MKQYTHIYFIGIGGIGMSAIARYFNKKGLIVAGYDKTSTSLTEQLERESIAVHYDDDELAIPTYIKHAKKDELLIVYTPAIPKNSAVLQYFVSQHCKLYKRSEILGELTKDHFTLAVAGTHGKTTTSTMLTHLLLSADKACTAFLGGISNNYANNFISNLSVNSANNQEMMVVEADEYDRSFLTLNPDIAIITSTDADHLDIYGDSAMLLESFRDFAKKVKVDGALIVKHGLEVSTPDVTHNFYTYALETPCDFYAQNISMVAGVYQFDLVSIKENIKNIKCSFYGLHNIENAVAAIAAAQLSGVKADAILKAMSSFEGVKRRFDCRFNHKAIVYIDDYAHHPTEINALIESVKAMYPGKKITGIFQPHLYSRTRDFADGFAQSLSALDELILMEIYPARELPITGVNSSMLLDMIHAPKKQLLDEQQIMNYLPNESCDVLLTIGAGDIDRLVAPIENYLHQRYKAEE